MQNNIDGHFYESSKELAERVNDKAIDTSFDLKFKRDMHRFEGEGPHYIKHESGISLEDPNTSYCFICDNLFDRRDDDYTVYPH